VARQSRDGGVRPDRAHLCAGILESADLFELAQRTGFDIESLIFSFAIGGIGAVLYNALTKRPFGPVSAAERSQPLHRFHSVALWAPYVLFVPLYLLPWNPIYPAILCMAIGGIASAICRPELKVKGLVGGAVFLIFYALFMLGLVWFTPGYIPQVWNPGGVERRPGGRHPARRAVLRLQFRLVLDRRVRALHVAHERDARLTSPIHPLSLPQDSSVLQGDRHTGVLRDHSRRIV
jgi:hypothetical protein